jgi:hypothetical protein
MGSFFLGFYGCNRTGGRHTGGNLTVVGNGVRRISEGIVAIGALIAFSLWIFVVLPFLYMRPNYDTGHNQTATNCSAEESKNHGFWEKTDCDPVAYFTLWLVGFSGVLAVSHRPLGCHLARQHQAIP